MQLYNVDIPHSWTQIEQIVKEIGIGTNQSHIITYLISNLTCAREPSIVLRDCH